MSKKLSIIPLLQWPLLLLGFMLFSLNVVLAQSQVIKGKVTDASGGPLAGANVSEKGGKKGAISDAAGNFTLTVSGPEAVLVFSYIGYNSVEIPIKGEAFINATMQADSGNTLS